MRTSVLAVVLLLVPSLVSAQPVCREIPGGRICAATPITNGAETLLRMPSVSNAAMWPAPVPERPTVTVIAGTPGSNSWMSFPPERERTHLDGSPIWMPYPKLGPDVVVVYDDGGAGVVAGPVGPEGPQGDPGADGARGLRGRTGVQGSQGIPGVDGVDGAPGPEGPQGLQGVQGVPGPQGVQATRVPRGPRDRPVRSPKTPHKPMPKR